MAPDVFHMDLAIHLRNHDPVPPIALFVPHARGGVGPELHGVKQTGLLGDV